MNLILGPSFINLLPISRANYAVTYCKAQNSCRVIIFKICFGSLRLHVAIVHSADLPLGGKAVLSLLGKKNSLSVFTGLGVGVSIAGEVCYH